MIADIIEHLLLLLVSTCKICSENWDEHPMSLIEKKDFVKPAAKWVSAYIYIYTYTVYIPFDISHVYIYIYVYVYV